VLGAVLDVQLIPSGEVMIKGDPEPTAQKRPSSGDQQIAFHWIFADGVRDVHVVPFEDVITTLIPTAQKRLSSGDQQISYQIWLGHDRAVQVTPSGDVMTLFEPDLATATKRLRVSDQQTEYHSLFSAGV
jgi:hypothetical protein